MGNSEVLRKELITVYSNALSTEVISRLSSSEAGLSHFEAQRRLKIYGLNQTAENHTYWWHILLRQLKSSFVYLLCVAAAIAFFFHEFIDGAVIIIFVGINTILGFYQEYRSEKTAQLLRRFTTPHVRVRREGNVITVATSTLVPGDIVILEPGDIVSADMRLIKAEDLVIDESVLTGESIPQEKTEIVSGQNSTQTIAFSGTTIMKGKGEAVVFATGAKSSLGAISKLASEVKRESSFEKGINGYSKFILRLVIVTLVFVFLANLIIKGAEAHLTELLIFSIALSVTVIPEALPVVISFSLSRGALKLAKQKVVVKRLSAIEDLGAIEVLCTDKTGTLTENKLEVADIFAKDHSQTFTAALLSNFTTRFTKNAHDAFDDALYKKLSIADQTILNHYHLIKDLPFDPTRRRATALVENKQHVLLSTRGALESILSISKLTPSEKKKLTEWGKIAGEKGLRVLAVAQKSFTHVPKQHISVLESDLNFLGMIAFSDPIKASTFLAVAQAQKLGVVIKVITGDSKEVAGSVAMQVNLIHDSSEVITGDELDAATLEEQHLLVESKIVFARINPQQKYRIIQLLQEKFEVGFLGEGINDAPALKIANVALVVSEASDIARENADIILLKKSLHTIIEGIQEGRSVFANTTKYIKATLSSNFGNFYAIAISSLFINFLPMLPLQILLVNMLSDFPMIAIATDNVDPAELAGPKRYETKHIALLATILGLVSTLFDFVFFGLFLRQGPKVLQTSWFMGSVLTELVFLFSIRTKFFVLKARPASLILSLLTILAALITIVLPFTPLGQEFFSFVALTGTQLISVFIIVGAYFIASESIKVLYYHLSPEI